MCGRAASSRGAGAVAVASGASRFLAASSYRPSFNVGPGGFLPVLRCVDDFEESKLVRRLENGEVDDEAEPGAAAADGMTKEEAVEESMPGASEENEDKSAAPVTAEYEAEEAVDDEEAGGLIKKKSTKKAATTSKDDHTKKDGKKKDDNDDEHKDGNGNGNTGGSKGSNSSSGSSTSSQSSSSGPSSSSSSSSLSSGSGNVNKLHTVVHTMQWGLVPFYTKPDQVTTQRYKTINARSETVASLPTFRRLVNKNRCVILADGFYEWYKYERGGKEQKQPYFAHPAAANSPAAPTAPPTSFTNVAAPSSATHLPVYPKDEYALATGAAVPPAKKKAAAKGVVEPSFEAPPLLYMAGLWDSWTDPESKKRLYSFTVLTTEATKEFGWIHDRMPVVLSSREKVDKWLDCAGTPFSECVPLLSPHRDNGLHWYPVADTASSIKNKTWECVQPLYLHMAQSKASGLGKFFTAAPKKDATAATTKAAPLSAAASSSAAPVKLTTPPAASSSSAAASSVTKTVATITETVTPSPPSAATETKATTTAASSSVTKTGAAIPDATTGDEEVKRSDSGGNGKRKQPAASSSSTSKAASNRNTSKAKKSGEPSTKKAKSAFFKT